MQSASLSKSSDSYRVPRRFSLAEILVLITVFALLFGGLRFLQAPAAIYLFLGTQAVIVCLAQMWFGEVPRGISALVGAVFLPAWIWVAFAMGGGRFLEQMRGTLLDVVVTVAFGGFLGYCTGALAAGVFMVMDMCERYCHRSN